MDETSFELFYESTARPLWAYIYRVSGNAALADEIMQEAYLRFLNSSLADLNDAQHRSYLYKIATNLINDHWRRYRHEQLQRQEPDYPISTDPDQHHDIAQILNELPMQTRTLLWLAYVEGSEHKEIAQTLGLKERSIRVLLFRARRKLADILKQHGFGPQEKI